MFSSERLKGIDVFVCVADYGSFTAAAEKMNLTASAISKSIARLEKRLGTRLFQRTTRRLSRREAEVIRLYVSGRSVNEIASEFNRSKQTISSQKTSAMRKLGIKRDVELIRFAREMGLVTTMRSDDYFEEKLD